VVDREHGQPASGLNELVASGWQPGVKSGLFHRAIKSHRSSYE